MLGILKRTCTSITDMNTRRTLYLSLVKSQLLYASEVWSPVNNVQPQGAQALICISVVCFSVYLFYECLYIAF